MKTNENASLDALSGPQSKALTALLSGVAISEAAAAAGVCHSTVWRWRHVNLAFKLALAQGKADQYQRIQAGIAALAADAIRVLGEVMNNPGAPDADRRAAAVAILDRLAPMSEDATDERIVRLAAATMEAEVLTKMAAAENDACMARILLP